MKRNTLIGLAAAAALVLGGGYWMLQRASVPASAPAASAARGAVSAGKPALTAIGADIRRLAHRSQSI